MSRARLAASCVAGAMSPARLAASCVAAVLAASAIAHATAGPVRTAPAVVTVADGPDVATGFMVAPRRVVTVAHVLDEAAPTVRAADGVAREAHVVRRDRALDLALLAVPDLHAAPLPDATTTRVLVRRDRRVTALPARIVRPIDARVRTAGGRGVASRPALELAARVAAGDSGAPVVRDGRVAGIVFARSHERPGVAYAVDAAVLARFVRW